MYPLRNKDTQRVNVVTARKQMADVVNRAAYSGERTILERRGKPVAAVIPVEDLETLERLEDRIDLEEALKARREGGKPISLEDVAAELGIALPKPARSRVKPRRRRRG